MNQQYFGTFKIFDKTYCPINDDFIKSQNKGELKEIENLLIQL